MGERFNPRTRMGCDSDGSVYYVDYTEFQSTHPHGVRPAAQEADIVVFDVSIHAPAWGATQRGRYNLHEHNVSIHAPAWGATQRLSSLLYTCLFQSTHPHGVRRRTAPFLFTTLKFQSTHPHGVRLVKEEIDNVCARFNPRTRMGCDTVPTLLTISDTMFQSTHPHGVRPIGIVCSLIIRSFQSTHPHGVRHWGVYYLESNSTFQSTHPHGVRHLQEICLQMGLNVSIHAPAWGATRSGYDNVKPAEFQSTHPHGVRRNWTTTYVARFMFQSTHPHGVRHYRCKLLNLSIFELQYRESTKINKYIK